MVEQFGKSANRGYGQGDYNRTDYGSGAGRNYGSGDDNRGGYGPREYGYGSYASRDRFAGDRQGQQRGYGAPYGNQDRWQSDRGGDYGANRDRTYGSQPQGYDYQDRGFMQRAGDEVRSWFGDDEAGRRREQDARQDQRYDNDRDDDYHSWRRGQIDALDRDYAEYRQENRNKFSSEFGTWRTGRQGQRDLLTKVTEHMDVVGSDGSHVGTVDHVRGDRILLTKSDQDAGGRHHSIPSSWIQAVDDKVTLRKSASEAQSHWRDEERNQAMFGNDRNRTGTTGQSSDDGRLLNRSFSGTY